MIKIENVHVHGWEAAIRGARNPMNSWDKSDSGKGTGKGVLCKDCKPNCQFCDETLQFTLGPNDHKLLMRLAKGGTEEAKWRRFIDVTMDIVAPLYWWKEFDTYKVATVSNSCSTMHKIQAKEFTLDDFSCEHLFTDPTIDANQEILDPVLSACFDGKVIDPDGTERELRCYAMDCLTDIIAALNNYRNKYNGTKSKAYWWQLIQLLPSSYNQRRTIHLNYEVLSAQYRQRKNHKLDEWITYTNWIRTLPYSDLITLEEANGE